ncbi:hypothetical protein FAF44_44435 [Nonomuraea sp. MG754425]|uniref:hypothetical protein n=1 Tax=Nonomuraea sp. MG754425 TaxID=2570319 RepID=UPI001F48DB34|nr:hypothetical protein [Nonomuraea sp. MG754425]MCF6475360.1 hypothetical protein [Nonomuraea sp. MG754425]
MIAVGAFLPWSKTYTQAAGIQVSTGFDEAQGVPFYFAWLGAMLAVAALTAGKATIEAQIAPGVCVLLLCGIDWASAVWNSDETTPRFVSDGLYICMAASVALIVIGVMAIVQNRRAVMRK